MPGKIDLAPSQPNSAKGFSQNICSGNTLWGPAGWRIPVAPKVNFEKRVKNAFELNKLK
jgi:hypothetical protein